MKRAVLLVALALCSCGRAPSTDPKSLQRIEVNNGVNSASIYCRNGWQVVAFGGGIMLDIDRAGNKIPCNENVTAPPPIPEKPRL